MPKRAKIWFFLLLVGFLGPIACLNAQQLLEHKISGAFTYKKIARILEDISEVTNINFSYNSDILPENKISIISNDWTIGFLLDTVLNTDSNLYKFEEFENHIIIVKENAPRRIGFDSSGLANIKAVHGVVLDQTSNNPIAYAHVYTSGRFTRTITNIDGQFTLNLENPLQTDTVVVSCIGFKTSNFLLNEVDTGKLTVELVPVAIQIEEVTVKPISPTRLISNAIKKIPDNYESQPSVLTAFYRETNKLNDKYYNISEAVLSIYKANYATEYDSDKVKILKARKNQGFKIPKDYNFKVAGGVYNNLKLDIVKDKASFIDPNDFDKYKYEYSGIVEINGRDAYEIRFDQKKESGGIFFMGKLHIDIETNAIVDAEFQISPKAIENAGSFHVLKKPFSAKIKTVYTFYKSEYIHKNEKWHLNHVKGEVRFNVLNRETQTYSVFSTSSEFIVTDKQTKDVKKFKRKEIAKANDIFVDQVPDSGEDKFWGKYNIIQPDKSLREAYKELNKDNFLFIINQGG